MEKHIITISREFGSGGRAIGKMVADKLGIKFYDRELIQLVAKESGFALDFVEETGEYSSTSSLLYNLSVGGIYTQGAFSPETLPPADKVQILQNNIIRDLAEKEPCVIVGRCADYVLRERKDLLNVFIHAPLSFRAERAQRVYEKQANNMEEFVRKKDKKRASFYNYFSQNKWGDARHYHLAISSVYGVDFAVEVLKHAALSFPEGVGE